MLKCSDFILFFFFGGFSIGVLYHKHVFTSKDLLGTFLLWRIKLKRMVFCLMGVSINGGTPKCLVYNGKSHKNGWLGGTSISGNLQWIQCFCFLLCPLYPFHDLVTRSWAKPYNPRAPWDILGPFPQGNFRLAGWSVWYFIDPINFSNTI